jgi:hypothetical protein
MAQQEAGGPMAKTDSGVEFHLVQIIPRREASIDEGSERLKREIRAGDAAFASEGHMFLALATDVRGVGQAVRRLLRLIRKHELPLRARLTLEPLPEDLRDVAQRVISEEIVVSRRAESGADR